MKVFGQEKSPELARVLGLGVWYIFWEFTTASLFLKSPFSCKLHNTYCPYYQKVYLCMSADLDYRSTLY
ncbi:MAG: hypothetical protein SFU27_02500 [Thermonemataceae bacterium]|nr:hypothetical protein [Thermonemataceae bacterium]